MKEWMNIHMWKCEFAYPFSTWHLLTAYFYQCCNDKSINSSESQAIKHQPRAYFFMKYSKKAMFYFSKHKWAGQATLLVWVIWCEQSWHVLHETAFLLLYGSNNNGELNWYVWKYKNRITSTAFTLGTVLPNSLLVPRKLQLSHCNLSTSYALSPTPLTLDLSHQTNYNFFISHDSVEKLKSHKSPGIDQIPAEPIKAGGRTFCYEIHKLINSIWNKEELPEEWIGSIMYLPITRAIKQTVVIIGAYHFCQLCTKFYPKSCCQG